jgi:uncharacterized membrane protein
LESVLGESSLRYLIAFLAVAGIVVSYLALRVHFSDESQPCSINEHWDCGVVNHSDYAEIYHVPVAAIGIAGYAAIAVLSLMGRARTLLIAAVIGLGFALYLTSIEARVLQVWCLYCVISQAIIATITVLSIVFAIWQSKKRPATA